MDEEIRISANDLQKLVDRGEVTLTERQQEALDEIIALNRDQERKVTIHNSDKDIEKLLKKDMRWAASDALVGNPNFGCGGIKGETIHVVEKQKRNELCACGSGKKFKRCCIGKS